MRDGHQNPIWMTLMCAFKKGIFFVKAIKIQFGWYLCVPLRREYMYFLSLHFESMRKTFECALSKLHSCVITRKPNKKGTSH